MPDIIIIIIKDISAIRIMKKRLSEWFLLSNNGLTFHFPSSSSN